MSQDKKKRSEEENTRTTGSVVGGAILGASIGGVFGALVGGVVGAVLGESVNDSRRNQNSAEKPTASATKDGANKRG